MAIYSSTYSEFNTQSTVNGVLQVVDAPSVLATTYYLSAAAPALGLLNPVNGVADRDIYALGVLFKGTYTFNARQPGNWVTPGYSYAYAPGIGLYDANGALVGGGSGPSFTFTVPVPGDYFLGVEGTATASSIYEVGYVKAAEVNIAPTLGSLAVGGFAHPGGILSVSGGLTDGSGLAYANTVTGYRQTWSRVVGGVSTEVGDGVVYAVSAADVGAQITLTVSYTDDQGFQESVTTAARSVVNPAQTVQGVRLDGSASSDVLAGSAGNDTFLGAGGIDILAGGAGRDTAVYRLAASNFSLSLASGTLYLTDRTGLEGSDYLVGMDVLQFADRNVPIESRSHGSFADLPPSVYQFFILAFGAAPGVEYLQQCADAYRGGASVKAITNAFCTKDEFYSVYPKTLSATDLATKLVNNVVGTAATAAAKQQAVSDILTYLALPDKPSTGDMVYAVFSALASTTAPEWATARKLFENQIAVAKVYSEVLNQSTTDRATLTAAIAAVKPDSALPNDAAIVQLIGQGLFGG